MHGHRAAKTRSSPQQLTLHRSSAIAGAHSGMRHSVSGQKPLEQPAATPWIEVHFSHTVSHPNHIQSRTLLCVIPPSRSCVCSTLATCCKQEFPLHYPLQQPSARHQPCNALAGADIKAPLSIRMSAQAVFGGDAAYDAPQLRGPVHMAASGALAHWASRMTASQLYSPK